MWERELVDSTGWNKQELVEEWRASWADKVNKVLAEIGVEDRVDHRSYERQGKDIEPTIHEGISRKMEEKYNNNDTTVFISDRMEENKKIREINSEISSLEKMMSFCKSAIEVIKEKIEAIKEKVVASIEKKKDFLSSLVRGDNIGGNLYEGGSDTGHNSDTSELQRPDQESGGGTSKGKTDDVLRAAEAAIESSGTDGGYSTTATRKTRVAGYTERQESDDTDTFIRQAEAKADGAISDREDRDAEQERLEAERVEREAERLRAARDESREKNFSRHNWGRSER